MSKRNIQTVEIPEKDVTVEEVQDTELVEETPVEEVVEKESVGKKIIRGLRKAAPILVIGGAIATAFALGRTSGTDAACLALLEAENQDSDEEESADDAVDSEESTEESND